MTKLVAVTGPIASGATTLARRLTEHLGWQPLFEEDVESDSPFFSLFHQDPHRYAFHNQVVFLTRSASRHLRLKTSVNNVLVQDYTPFEHNEVYAKVQHRNGLITLEERGLLNRLTAVLMGTFVIPQVLLFRPLNEELLLDRVQTRKRPSEQGLELDYLKEISQEFESWIKTWSRSPVIRVKESLDVLDDQYGFEKLVEKVKEAALENDPQQN